MKTSTRKYNEQYRLAHLLIDGTSKPQKLPYCNEHKRCDVCRSHVQAYGYIFDDEGSFLTYRCPTCGKCYAVLYEEDWHWTEEENEDD